MCFRLGRSNQLFISLASVIYLSCYGTQPAAASFGSAQQIVDLSLKPKACIVEQLGHSCTVKITANWQAPSPQSLCLVMQQSLAAKEIKCWDQQIAGTKQFVVELTTTTQFRLVDLENRLLNSVDLVINAAHSTKYRRRLRADWSVF